MYSVEQGGAGGGFQVGGARSEVSGGYRKGAVGAGSRDTSVRSLCVGGSTCSLLKTYHQVGAGVCISGDAGCRGAAGRPGCSTGDQTLAGPDPVSTRPHPGGGGSC